MYLNPRRYPLIIMLAAVLFALYLLPGCDILGGSGGSDWTDASPIEICKANLTGTWEFKTPSATGHIVFSENEKVTGITMSSCFGMTAKPAQSITRIEGDTIVIYYVAVCKGKSYAYTLTVRPSADCHTMTGTKTGNYSGGGVENFTMKKT